MRVDVDEWIDNFMEQESEEEPRLNYAKFFLFCKRLRAVDQMNWGAYFPEKLFCTYQGVRYRVTGASRMGDIYLTTDFNQDIGYQKRGVFVNEVSNWSPEA